MIELIAAALLQIAVMTTDGSTVVPSSDATTYETTTATTTTNTDGTGGAGNWDDGN